MKNVLLSKSDELSWGVRDFLEKLKKALKKTKQGSFKSQDIRNMLAVSPRNLKYYLSQLVAYGHLKVIGGNRYRGFEYELLKPEEYEELKEELRSALDSNLERIKDRIKEK